MDDVWGEGPSYEATQIVARESQVFHVIIPIGLRLVDTQARKISPDTLALNFPDVLAQDGEFTNQCEVDSYGK